MTSDRLTRLPHGFFGRQGGISTGIYRSLNAGLGSSDEAAAVAENRERVRFALGADHLVTAWQSHSAVAAFVDGPTTDTIKADALVTDRPGIAIGVLAADCVPILLHARKGGLVAAIHAGWKGSLGGVVEATVALMRDRGANPADISGALGPCLRAPAFEVGDDLRDAVLARHPLAVSHFKAREEPGKWTYDHVAFVIDRLAAAGVSTNALTVEGECTLTHPDRWFSYRHAQGARQPDYGRNISAIAIPAT